MLKFWKRMNILYERLLLIALIGILLIVVWCMYDNYYVYSHTLDNSILRYKPGQSTAVREDSPISEEMAAWITIDGTGIDYPVMQGSDNIKYLNTDPFGNYALSGSIYLDSRNSSDFSDEYSLIYGHHMEYGKMFGALDEFLNASYLDQHRTGTLIIGRNAEEIYPVEVFASMRASAKDDAVFELGDPAVRQFIKEHAEVYTADSERRIIALSTCAEGDSVSRVLVFCYITD